jgi:hypothetical protein
MYSKSGRGIYILDFVRDWIGMVFCLYGFALWRFGG